MYLSEKLMSFSNPFFFYFVFLEYRGLHLKSGGHLLCKCFPIEVSPITIVLRQSLIYFWVGLYYAAKDYLERLTSQMLRL